MPEEKKVQNLIGINPFLVKCIMKIIESHHPDDWKDLGLYVYVDAETKDIYLDDFLLSEKKEAKDPCGIVYPCGSTDNEYDAENILVYFYTCITAIENRLKYEEMRKEEEDAREARRCDDNKVGGAERGRSENPDNAEHPLPDSRPRSSDSAGA